MKDSRRSHFVTVTGVILMICAIIGTLVSGGVFVFVFSITAVNGQDLSVAATEFADSEDIVPLAAFILSESESPRCRVLRHHGALVLHFCLLAGEEELGAPWNNRLSDPDCGGERQSRGFSLFDAQFHDCTSRN